VLEHTMLLDLVAETSGERGESASEPGPQERVTGITVLRDGRIEHLAADAVVLATGGAGQVFAHTTNPAAATGDGLAAALRAGATVRDLEFFQFHPTALAGPGFLISEAVRGAGARIVDEQGRRFLPEVDDRAELAPRNVVALALHRRSVAQNGRPCFLDARLVPEFADRFPSITHGLAAYGLNPAHDLIPVTPAAHYFMGGIATDLAGRTSIAGLYAVGEVACTGVHGANRLASNSLLEAAVFAARAARAIAAELGGVADPAATAPICVDPPLPRRMSLSPQKALPRTGLAGNCGPPVCTFWLSPYARIGRPTSGTRPQPRKSRRRISCSSPNTWPGRLWPANTASAPIPGPTTRTRAPSPQAAPPPTCSRR